jgi:hypothetical protein
MATTVDRDLNATDDPLAIDLAVSMAEQVAALDTDTTQFTTMLMRLPEKTAASFKEEWLQDVFLPRNTALSASATSADTTFALTTNEGAYAKVGDTFKFVQTGEAIRITGVSASAWTGVRAIGSVSAASAVSGTSLGGIIILSGSNEQGGTLPTSLVTEKTSNYNYMQIVRNSYRFTATAEWVRWYSGNPLAYHRKKIGIEHKRDIEDQAFFGARSYTAGTNAPRCTFGGLDEFITTNKTDAGGTFDKGELQDFLRAGLEYGNADRKVMFAAPIVAQVMSEFLQDNWVQAQLASNPSVFGVKADAVISGVTGGRIPVFVKNDWRRFGEGTGLHIGSRAYLVDMDDIEFYRAPATQAGSRFATLYKNRQAPDADETAEEYLSEVSLKVGQEKRHALLTGCTG